LLSGAPAKSGPEPERASVSSIAAGESPIGIIVSSPNSNDCHRYELDKATGARTDKGTTKCIKDGGGSVARIEAISNAFKNKAFKNK
jgi:hypothetical protein